MSEYEEKSSQTARRLTDSLRTKMEQLLINVDVKEEEKLIEELQSNNLVLEAVCLLNINSFKEVNDFFGHKVGDAILIDVAKLIDEKIKKVMNIFTAT